MSAPTLQDIPLDSLREPPQNPNSMPAYHFELLKRGVEREGFNTAILAREVEAGVWEIVDGVHRVRAARELGYSEVPAYTYAVGDCSDAKAAALQIGFNRLRGELDLTAVARQLADLDLVGLDLAELAGYRESEAQALLDSLAPVNAEDLLGDGPSGPSMDPEEEPPPAKAFDLVIAFETAGELAQARRTLRRAAGKTKDLGLGFKRLAGIE